MINLTQHKSTPDQDCRDLSGSDLDKLKELLTFEQLPTRAEIKRRAELITALAEEAGEKSAMIGGAPYLMPALELELLKAGITAYYAFTQRVVTERMEGGQVIKTATFQHAGFIPAFNLQAVK